MTAAAAAVLAAAVLGVLGWLVHRAARLERLLEAHNRDEADIKWTDEEIERLERAIREDGEGL
jgi:hypothetical protein